MIFLNFSNVYIIINCHKTNIKYKKMQIDIHNYKLIFITNFLNII